MKTRHGVRLVLGLSCVLAALPVMADGWSFPSLNPFKTEKKEVSPYVPATRDWSRAEEQEPPTSGLKLPKLKMPTFGAKNKMASNEPSTMQRMTQGAKNIFTKTADVLNPFDDGEKGKPRSARSTGVRRTYNGSPSAARAGKKEGGFFSSLFSGDDEEPESARTVNGFLGQPRPKY